MPLRDSDDIYSRFRATRPTTPPRQPVSADVKAASMPRFPGVGMSLPPRQPLPARPAPVRPSAPATNTAPARPVSPVRPVAPDRPRQSLNHSLPPRQPDIAPARAVQPVRKAARRQNRLGFLRGIITWGRVVLAVILILLLAGGWFGIKMLANVQKVFHGSVFSILTTTKLVGEETGRINILVAGNSADDPGHDGANLTDSIMVLSINVKDNSAFMLSVPRDMWVDIPGFGHAKINEAYVDGEYSKFSAPGYFNGGMGLLQQVVERNFGLKADYYALVDYNALRDGVDAVGGVDINVQSSDPRGLYDPSIDWGTHGPLVKLKNGMQHLDGREALDLARARGDAPGAYGFPRSDFDRTEHQRMLILALKEKVLQADTLSNPIKLSGLFDSIGKNVKTNFSLSEVRRLYDLGKNIKTGSIQSIGLNDAGGVNLLANYASPTGQSALIPSAGIDDFSKIKAYLDRITTSNPVVREGATVVVLNGTRTAGLAAQTQKLLTSKDVNVTAIGDAKTTATTTTIIDTTNGTKPGTLDLFNSLFANKTVTAQNPYAGTYQADFIIIIGGDWIPPNTTTASQQ